MLLTTGLVWVNITSDQKQKQLTLSELFPGALSPFTPRLGSVIFLVTTEEAQGGIGLPSTWHPHTFPLRSAGQFDSEDPPWSHGKREGVSWGKLLKV